MGLWLQMSPSAARVMLVSGLLIAWSDVDFEVMIMVMATAVMI